MLSERKDIRNIAIIAHVDHGKTTLVDELLKQSGTVTRNVDRVMDSGDIEKERGITILAKNTLIELPEAKVNIVDTPGHMDFGGEVERTLQMVEAFLLLVDAAEGPLPGTRFVLQKALQLKLKPIVLINKIDRQDADIERTEELITNLFLDVAVDESQLDFPILYGSSKLGFVSEDPSARSGSMEPLFKTIIEQVPCPKQSEDNLQMLITNLDYCEYLGRMGIGRIFNGTIKRDQNITICKGEDISNPIRVTKLFQFLGTARVEVNEAKFGDIVVIAGLPDEQLSIGSTISSQDNPAPLPYVEIDEPTLSVNFGVNTSPFAGREGNLLTSRQIRSRLYKETRTNLALRVEDTDSGEFKVSGRGQLHLAILMEQMRREGFEIQISAPDVIYKYIDGKKYEPFELLTIDVYEEHKGIVMENLGQRKALLEDMEYHSENKVKMEFKIPVRGLIGFRSKFITDTRGTGIMGHRFAGYEPYIGELPMRSKGSIISMEQGDTKAYALDSIQTRGTLFINPGTEVYCGMIIGENSRESDLDVNPTKGKKLTNMRASGSDDTIRLAPPREVALEPALDWIKNDELIEITPQTIRLRKKYLQLNERKRARELS